MEQAIVMQNFTKRYQDFAIENMNLEIPTGYITGFVGKNGAGKTTTIKGMLDMFSFEGEVAVLGSSVREHAAALKNRIGIVPSGFIEECTVKDFVRIIAPFYAQWDMARFTDYIRRFEVSMDKKISELSRGMRVKLGLAVALSHHAELFLLDEPTAGLDPMVRDEILDIFMDLMQDEKKTIFFSTHITSDLDKVADYIVLIEQGHILFNQPKDQLLDQHVLVKGERGRLTDTLKAQLVGYKEHDYGFEGLSRPGGRITADGLVTARPNVEQLMMYYIRGIEHELD